MVGQFSVGVGLRKIVAAKSAHVIICCLFGTACLLCKVFCVYDLFGNVFKLWEVFHPAIGIGANSRLVAGSLSAVVGLVIIGAATTITVATVPVIILILVGDDPIVSQRSALIVDILSCLAANGADEVEGLRIRAGRICGTVLVILNREIVARRRDILVSAFRAGSRCVTGCFTARMLTGYGLVANDAFTAVILIVNSHSYVGGVSDLSLVAAGVTGGIAGVCICMVCKLSVCYVTNGAGGICRAGRDTVMEVEICFLVAIKAGYPMGFIIIYIYAIGIMGSDPYVGADIA